MKNIFLFLTLFSICGLVNAERLSGPRIGVTYLDKQTQDYLKGNDINLTAPAIMQFGWQFERKFFSTKSGPEGITEIVPLVGGFEQGLFAPSVSFLVGLRSRSGFEFVVGPNLSITSTGVVFAVGKSTKMGEMNVPVNLAYATTKNGGRISLLIGFNAVEPPTVGE